MMSLEVEKYALEKILEVLLSPWRPGINYDRLKAAADRHVKNIWLLEGKPLPTGAMPAESETK